MDKENLTASYLNMDVKIPLNAQFVLTNCFLVTIENKELGTIFQYCEVSSFEEIYDQIKIEVRPLITNIEIIDKLLEKCHDNSPKWVVKNKNKFNIKFEMVDPTGVTIHTDVYKNCLLERVIKPKFSYPENKLALYTLVFRK